MRTPKTTLLTRFGQTVNGAAKTALVGTVLAANSLTGNSTEAGDTFTNRGNATTVAKANNAAQSATKELTDKQKETVEQILNELTEPDENGTSIVDPKHKKILEKNLSILASHPKPKLAETYKDYVIWLKQSNYLTDNEFEAYVKHPNIRRSAGALQYLNNLRTKGTDSEKLRKEATSLAWTLVKEIRSQPDIPIASN